MSYEVRPKNFFHITEQALFGGQSQIARGQGRVLDVQFYTNSCRLHFFSPKNKPFKNLT